MFFSWASYFSWIYCKLKVWDLVHSWHRRALLLVRSLAALLWTLRHNFDHDSYLNISLLRLVIELVRTCTSDSRTSISSMNWKLESILVVSLTAVYTITQLTSCISAAPPIRNYGCKFSSSIFSGSTKRSLTLLWIDPHDVCLLYLQLAQQTTAKASKRLTWKRY